MTQQGFFENISSAKLHLIKNLFFDIVTLKGTKGSSEGRKLGSLVTRFIV